jgi:hypothetical protein
MKLRFAFAFTAVAILCTCTDPFTPNLKGDQSLLVVDGLLTDGNSSNLVRLTRTFQDQTSEPESVSGATVFVTDDIGTSSYLIEAGNGVYKTDSIEFRGKTDRTYILHIQTKDGQVYESDPCLMQPVPEIDSLYFAKDQEPINNGTQVLDGIMIYLDSKEGNNNQYYRWTFDETWKFKVPFPKRYNFDPADSSITPVANVKDYCWKNTKSDNIVIYANYSGQTGPVRNEPLFFIASDQSDRLLIEYSISVNQYSISKREYEFWNNLKKVNESTGDIFAKQPYSVLSNINNINNPKDRVLGYFQVSSVKSRRKFISFNDIVGLNLPTYHYPCESLIKNPNDFPIGYGAKRPTWDEIFTIYCINSDYYFVDAQFTSIAGGKKNISRMVFARPECANCELTGTRKKPDFWIDLN